MDTDQNPPLYDAHPTRNRIHNTGYNLCSTNCNFAENSTKRLSMQAHIKGQYRNIFKVTPSTHT